MVFESYWGTGDKKGYWQRVRGILIQYVARKVTLETLILNVSEELRARDDELWSIFASVGPSEPDQVQLLRKAEERCIQMGFMHFRT
jgi:hypothetical protein